VNVAFIYDPGNRDGTRGGAELAMDEFALAAPEGVTLTKLGEADTVLLGNCILLKPEVVEAFEGKRVIRFHHDLARDESDALWDWLDENAEHIFTSPFHRDLYGHYPDAHLIPPTPNLKAFRPNRHHRRHGKREGMVAVGSWQSLGKGGNLAADAAYRAGKQLDCYGPGAYPPRGGHVRYLGEVDAASLPAILWQYEEFVFLPVAPEPFGRCVAEAWAAGCDVTVNEQVGAKWWIENDPDKLWTAAEDFWELVA
jgi:hypothetical protein